MIDNFNLTFLSGGFYRCDSNWNKASSNIDQCYKFYFPVSGEASVVIEGETHTFKPGRIYFFSGFKITKQFCNEHMDVYWMHFIPESPLLSFLLNKCTSFVEWTKDDIKVDPGEFINVIKLFSNPFDKLPKVDPFGAPIAVLCKIEALMLLLIGNLFEKQMVEKEVSLDTGFLKVKPGLDFINQHFREKISLKDIAASSFLAPNYFHQVFKKTFGFTPLDYLTKKKLDTARHLLTNTTNSIGEIAEQVGFNDQYYFSKLFKKSFKKCPSELRKPRLAGKFLKRAKKRGGLTPVL